MDQENSLATEFPDNATKEFFNLAHIQGFFPKGQSSELGGCLFPQLPCPSVPLGERPFASNVLLKS